MRFKDKGCPACYLKRVNGPAQQAKKPDPVKQVFVDQTPKTRLPPPLPPAANRSFFTSPFFIVAMVIIGAVFYFSRDKGPKINSNTTQSTVNYSSTLPSNLCGIALNSNKDGWEDRSQYRLAVQEANRRGLSIADCRRELGLTQSSINAAQSTAIYNTYTLGVLCGIALNSNKDGWESRSEFQLAVQEAQSRGYTVDTCRSYFGLSQANSNSTQSTGIYSSFPPRNLCEFALNSNKKGWEDQSQYRLAVQEAQSRGYTIDICREYLGLGQGPSPIEPPYGNNEELSEGELVYCWRHTEILKILDVKMGRSNYTEQQRNGFNNMIENIENKCKFDKKSSDIRNNRAKYVEFNKENIIEEADKILEEW
jgi:hypothetical protein